MMTPVLRFGLKSQIKEFRLSEVGSFFGGLSGKTKDDFGYGSDKFITYMNVFSNVKAKENLCELVSIKEDEKQNEVTNGDILFTQSSETPEEVGMASVWLHKHSVYLNSFCFGYRINSKENIDPLYLCYLLRSPSYRKKISKEAQGISRYNLASSRLDNIKIKVPSLEEQKNVSTFFSLLDEKIEISKRKINLLESIGTTLLSKLFAGEKRFHKTENSSFRKWDDVFVENVAKVSSGKRVHRSEWKTEGIPFYRTSDVMSVLNGCKNPMGEAFISEVLYKELTEDNEKLEENDLLVTGGGSVGVPYVVTKTPLYTKDADLLWLKPDHNKVNSMFLYYFFFSKEFRRFLSKISHSGTIAHYTITQLKETPIQLPELEEQERIVEFLNCFYEKVEIEKKRLTLLNDQKKSLLKKMFV